MAHKFKSMSLYFVIHSLRNTAVIEEESQAVASYLADISKVYKDNAIMYLNWFITSSCLSLPPCGLQWYYAYSNI